MQLSAENSCSKLHMLLVAFIVALDCSLIPLTWQNPAKLQIGTCSCTCRHALWKEAVNKCWWLGMSQNQNGLDGKGPLKAHLVQPQHPPCSLVSAHWSWVQASLVLGSAFPWCKHEGFRSMCDLRLSVSVKWGCSIPLKDACRQHHLGHHSPPWGKRGFCPKSGLKPFAFKADRSSWAWKQLAFSSPA